MKVKTIKGAWGIPIAYDRKFLGFRLVYKGYMKNMPNGYEGNFPKPKYKLTQWISDKTKKFVQKLFPDYVVETKAQYNARLEANHNSEMEGLTVGKIQKIIFDPEDVKKMENMTLKEQIKFKNHLRDIGKYTLEE